PGGAAPYSAALISLSVPSTPTRRTLTSTPRPFGTWSTEGFGNSATWTLLGFPGNTLMAFIPFLLITIYEPGFAELRSAGRVRAPAPTRSETSQSAAIVATACSGFLRLLDSPLCCINLVTTPVHPVWLLAPTPVPESPWKYS